VEPYSPEFRRALKDAHPGLRDADIDRLEELTTRRAQMQSVRYARAVANLEIQINELLRSTMPDFDRVARQHAAMQHAERASHIIPRVEVKPKR
jgi:hypothetical protein